MAFSKLLIRPLVNVVNFHRLAIPAASHLSNSLNRPICDPSAGRRTFTVPLDVRFFSSELLPKPNITFTVQEPAADPPPIDPTNDDPLASLPASEADTVDLSEFLVDPTKLNLSEAGEGVAKIAEHLSCADLNLTWWCPTNLVYQILEFLHQFLPWYGAIAVLTVLARILVFPLTIMTQRQSAKMSYHMPKMQLLQAKLSEARRAGNHVEVTKLSYQLQDVMGGLNNSIFRSMAVPMAQMPIFLSVFFVLRAMASYPVDSMKTGGLSWFTDLTLADPYYILPLTTSVTLFVMFKLGIDTGASATSANNTMLRVMTYILPPVTFAFTYHFPAAVLLYWCTSNFISFGQVMTLKHPTVREFFKIPPIKKWDPSELPPKKSVGASFMESIDNSRLTSRLNERRRLQQTEFQKAGIGPLQKTYKTDPTKIKSAKSV